ncbi:MAG: carboxylesterase/lipase family protein [Clostridiales bacterium]|nr:carboxylesterase/lipase family protein [Clostridiales bacterium]
MVKTDAFATTKAGKLQGVCIDGVYRFLGVHYAETTAGENRFMPPQPLIPWEGVRPALDYVAKCWQTDTPRMEDKEITTTKYFVNQQRLMVGSSEMGTGRQTEDCLALNIWSKGLRDGKKRPVMVWFHGGGNIAGAAEADWHDGYNLALKQDVVVVTIGHRLGIFGYMYLCSFSEKYKNSANLGHQDMVAALKWINENIEEFGGDPGNITLFGQPGGGGKVAALMAMPSAKGLFQKAIIQSGGHMASPPEDGTMYAKQLLDFLNIDTDNVDELLKIPPEDLIEASREINRSRTLGTYFQSPVINDGEVIKYDPFDGAEGSEMSKNIRLISGYTKDDAMLQALFNPVYFSYTFDELPEKIVERGYSEENAKKLIEIYKKLLGSECTACDVYSSLLNDESHLMRTKQRYESRAKVGAVPMFSYVFCFESPDEDMKAIHGVDVPFFFDNAIYAPGLWNADTRVGAMKVSEDAAAAWAAFARTGDPSNPAMPVWKPYDEENKYTMLIDVESKLVTHYREEALEIILASKK